ncbi:uncharacterized protein RSE6_00461 [Rhynchosporium secalis]|uniref:Uncharacterized protein n=1 Tax=Rhynchosporium secalis TaxID=38038 RepID=A0A1E1LVB1_RHYSE|nr:uncharacterized protein RSE6_00461 [Rhynchosporium secalis]
MFNLVLKASVIRGFAASSLTALIPQALKVEMVIKY